MDNKPNSNKDAMTGSENDSIMKFPCEFTYKAFGKNNEQFINSVKKIFDQEHPETTPDSWQKKTSKDGNYLSISITVNAESKQKLDAVYMLMTKDDHILMAL